MLARACFAKQEKGMRRRLAKASAYEPSSSPRAGKESISRMKRVGGSERALEVGKGVGERAGNGLNHCGGRRRAASKSVERAQGQPQTLRTAGKTVPVAARTPDEKRERENPVTREEPAVFFCIIRCTFIKMYNASSKIPYKCLTPSVDS